MDSTDSSQACWVISDVHGHAAMLEALVQKIDARSPGAPLLFVGDLVNRGPDDLGTLCLVRELGERAQVALGNHDLLVLACAAGLTAPRGDDTIQQLVQHPSFDEHVDWLRHQPLMLERGDDVVVHAGWHPSWTLATARDAAARIQHALRADDWARTLGRIWGYRGAPWRDEGDRDQRLGDDLAAFTRMRLVFPSGDLDARSKGGPGTGADGTMPWYEAPNARSSRRRIIFGHWAAHGVMVTRGVAAIDGGVAWGGPLTALCLNDDCVLEQPRLD